MVTELQRMLNALATGLASIAGRRFESHQNPDGSATYTIARSDHGDVGLTTENDEITIFGLGGHQHFSSSMGEFDEIKSQEPEMCDLINGLLNKTVCNCESYHDDMPLGGGYGKVEGGRFHVGRIPAKANRITISILEHPLKTMGVADESIVRD